jgi:DNA-binding MarR family transcriptional regulator
LEEFDLTRREPDPRDRRSILVQRTATGMKFLRELRQILHHAATAAGLSVAPEQSRQAIGDMAAYSAG